LCDKASEVGVQDREAFGVREDGQLQGQPQSGEALEDKGLLP